MWESAVGRVAPWNFGLVVVAVAFASVASPGLQRSNSVASAAAPVAGLAIELVVGLAAEPVAEPVVELAVEPAGPAAVVVAEVAEVAVAAVVELAVVVAAVVAVVGLAVVAVVAVVVVVVVGVAAAAAAASFFASVVQTTLPRTCKDCARRFASVSAAPWECVPVIRSSERYAAIHYQMSLACIRLCPEQPGRASASSLACLLPWDSYLTADPWRSSVLSGSS